MNNKDSVIIPQSLHLVVDDVGWFNSTDERLDGGPARTGMPRGHIPSDYAAINELGKRLGMKITCAFILGEWDPDNRLATIPHLSNHGDRWNNKAYFNPEKAKKIVEIINSSEYIDFTVHGLLHGNYRPEIGSGHWSDYYYKKDGVACLAEEDEIRKRLDAYFDLVQLHGIKKEIRAFVPPSFVYRYNELAPILRDYGIRYVSTTFRLIKQHSRGEVSMPEYVDIDNGLIILDRNNDLIRWYEEESDPRTLDHTVGIFGSHWPNLLHANPDRQEEITAKWEEYFKGCAEQFGTVLSSGIDFAATQSIYRRFAKVEYTSEGVRIDLSEIPENEGLLDSFVVSSREPIVSFEGCEVSLYEKKSAFYNYKVVPECKRLLLKN